jgi:hypothetical protein
MGLDEAVSVLDDWAAGHARSERAEEIRLDATAQVEHDEDEVAKMNNQALDIFRGMGA